METPKGKKALPPRSADPRLYGWDDGKICYRDDAGRERCVTDMPELLGELEGFCARRFAQTAIPPALTESCTTHLSAATPAAGLSRHATPDIVIDLERPVDLVALSVGVSAVRCRLLDTDQTVTVRLSRQPFGPIIPGELIRVRPSKTWRYARNLYLSADLLSTWIDIPALRLAPLGLTKFGRWDPKTDMLNDNGNTVADPSDLSDIERKIYNAGARDEYEFQQILPGSDPDNPDSDPILDAVDLANAGNIQAARKQLMALLVADLRCLDAHAHLGNLRFDAFPEAALRHYQIGKSIGELSLPPGFQDLLPWGLIDNRPYLRCLHGYGLCLWHLKRQNEALAIFERMLWLNPMDNQGARFNRHALLADRTWEKCKDF